MAEAANKRIQNICVRARFWDIFRVLLKGIHGKTCVVPSGKNRKISSQKNDFVGG